MHDLGPEAFDDFFRAVWGQPPFAWQHALARLVLDAQIDGRADGSWPETIALPTASGKTACIDIAVFALASQAARVAAGRPLAAPRRVFFVVDRRVIVDEAVDRARALASALADAADGVVRDIADRLRLIGDSHLPLVVHALRGGQLRADGWAATPLQPAVIASTVDQVGSRLLFRSYGTGTGMWPVHAGLVGNDSLILLDEAHCAQPMLETLRAVRRYRGWSEQPVPVPFEVAVMSATPPEGAGTVFRDASEERRDPLHPLGRRQLAAKPALLVLADRATGRNAARVRAELAAVLADRALRLGAEVPAVGRGEPAVVVFCNRVDTARRVHALLKQDAADVHLVTGRMRPIDKDDTIASALAPLASRRAPERRLERPCFVVATQTLEVGADIDFDLLVTECASLDALRQRFGRLNRGGRPVDARAVIVATAAQLDDGVKDDPVYGGAIGATWAFLSRIGDGGTVDMGIAALEPSLPVGDAVTTLNAPPQQAPVLLPSHVDVLAQTAPVPMPTPEVSLFLHGPRSGPADVQVCWRADLGSQDNPAEGLDALLRCPPSSPECLAVPFVQMRRWLDGESPPAGADIEGADIDDVESGPPVSAAPRRALRWRGRDASAVIDGGSALRPGDLIVLPAALGGFDELATLGASVVADWGDRAYAAMRRDAVLRLNPAVLAQWPDGESRQPLDALLARGRADWDEDPATFAAELQQALLGWAVSLADPRWQWLQRIVGDAGRLRRLDRALSPHPCGGWIVEIRRPAVAAHAEAAAATAAFFGDEDDAASSGHFRSLLVEPMSDRRSHLQGVGALARRYAQHCGLPPEFADAIGRAGDGHDLGKADPRFQAWLRNGVPWVGGPLLAKSAEMPQGRVQNAAARARAGYPENGRHELLSVRLIESCADALPPNADLHDLTLHLIESHHGHCRPFAPVVVDEAPVDVTVDSGGRRFTANSATGLEKLDAGPAERFWRLTRRHGWWGLAWLEALLRLADHRRSEWEQQHGKL